MGYWHSEENRVSIPVHEPGLPKWAWCLVANIRRAGFPNAGPLDSHGGTKHFAPGARVYVFPVHWDGWWDRGPVLGKQKGSRRYVRKVIGWEWLENFRCKRVYSPTVISWMMGARSEIRNYGSHSPYSSGDWLDGWGDVYDYEHGQSDLVRGEIERIVRYYRDGTAARLIAEREAHREGTIEKLGVQGDHLVKSGRTSEESAPARRRSPS